MRVKTYREAIIEAMMLEMRRDEKVFVIGEDISGGRGCGDFEGEAAGGPMGLTQGLWNEFGAKRVIDTPIAETGFTGIGVGSAMNGLRPIIEFMTFNFSLVAIDQIINGSKSLLIVSNSSLVR